MIACKIRSFLASSSTLFTTFPNVVSTPFHRVLITKKKITLAGHKVKRALLQKCDNPVNSGKEVLQGRVLQVEPAAVQGKKACGEGAFVEPLSPSSPTASP